LQIFLVYEAACSVLLPLNVIEQRSYMVTIN